MMKNRKINLQFMDTIEIYLFLISIILQDFAILTFGSSGISPILIICIIIAIRHKFLVKVNISYIIVILLIIIKLLIDKLFFVNVPIVSIIRVIMIMFIMIISFKYIQYIHKHSKEIKFNNIFLNLILLTYLYGIYSILAHDFKLPLFLNIFRNNPTYYVGNNIYNYFGGGWVDNMRVFATFAEPSMYAYFIILTFVFISNCKINKKRKLLFYGLGIINLYNTYSRSGYTILIYFIIIMCIYSGLIKILNKELVYKKIQFLVLLIPFINIYLMYIGNNELFNDMSSDARTNSSIFYLWKSFENIKTFLFGHGYKSIELNFSYINTNMSNIEPFAHNGFIEVIYEFGFISFIFTILLFMYTLLKIHDIKKRVILLSIIIPPLSFSSFFYIESIISMYAILIASFIYYKNNEYAEVRDKDLEKMLSL